jgi:outer membrane protein insertion porin family
MYMSIMACGQYTKNYAESIDFVPHESFAHMQNQKKIRSIIIKGNSYTTNPIIISKLPFHEGEMFNASKTNAAIRLLYSLGYYKTITIGTHVVDDADDTIDLIVNLTEKPQVEQWMFTGNKHLSQSEIEKKLLLSKIKTLDIHELSVYAEKIKKLYGEKDYHDAQVSLTIAEGKKNSVIVTCTVVEGKTAYIRKVFFRGNETFSNTVLKKILFSREAWIFGFFNKAGSYRAEALDYDSYIIENFYHSRGFISAHVQDIEKKIDPCTNAIDITFVIDEGDRYCIDSVHAPENEEFSEDEILKRIPLQPGLIYSQEVIKQIIEGLKTFFGERGYLYADVQPSIRPNKETKKVDISFHSHLGSKIYVDTIAIRGNYKTRDYIIRRHLTFNEGEVLTQRKMDATKANVERLGFFDPADGVSWKIHRLDDTTADVDLIVHERKTGKFFVEGSFGPGQGSGHSTFKFGLGAYDTNLMGTGLQYNINARMSTQDRDFLASFSNPWLFNRPIFSSVTTNYTQVTYEDMYLATACPLQKLLLFDTALGFVSAKLNFARVGIDGGFNHVKYNQKPISSHPNCPFVQEYLNWTFVQGHFYNFGVNIEKDLRNHPAYPNSGYHWLVSARFAFPSSERKIGFDKFEADLHWYTPLINTYDLILHFHGHAGYIHGRNNNSIPYGELFHIGGPSTVRGFTFGQISPNLFNTSIGATKAGYVSAELIFPLQADMSMRGLVFYDGGAGWDTPCTNIIPCDGCLRNNKFNYRHAVGFGIRLTSPAPVSIDWGFKLDRNKRKHEKYGEIHFSMSQAF